MGLFTRLEKAQLAAQEDAHQESVAYMAGEIEALNRVLTETETELINTIARHKEDMAILKAHNEEQVKRLTDQATRLKDQAETAGHLATVEMARREGQVGELLGKGKLLDVLREQHEWVKDGQCSAHGVVMDVWRCVHCMSDPMANTRVLLPAATKWRMRDEA
jgi:hypothetical protein